MSTRSRQTSLVSENKITLSLPDADVEYYPRWLDEDVAWGHYRFLREHTDWRQETVKVYGKRHLTPRLSSWVGDAGTDYQYSHLTMVPRPWSPRLNILRQQVESVSCHPYNSVLLNYYRNGQDSNGWHSDDEPELGADPVIASLSLGAARDFCLRHRQRKVRTHKLSLEHGSLLIMRGTTQRFWQHQIPKRAQADGRINLTFRNIEIP